MREPYRTLFEGFADHRLIGQYLLGDEPDWSGMANIAQDDLESLGTGEKVYLYIAGFFRPGRELDQVDRNGRLQLAQALLITCREAW